MEAHRILLEKNIVELEKIALDLEKQRETLLYDPIGIKLVARKLGYFAKEEGQIILLGMEQRNSSYTLGRMIRLYPGAVENSPKFRVIGFGVAIMAGVVMFFFRRKGQDRIANR